MTRAQAITIRLVGALAFAPLVFIWPEIATMNAKLLDVSNADVLGGGTLLIFLAMMTITPLILVTGKRWFQPLRWWFGVMMFATAAVDFIIASIVTGGTFDGGFVGRIAGHTFLAVGTLMVMLLVPLTVTANRRSQKWLGKHWKTVQRLTYVVWALILLHLALLFGLTGGRFQQALVASVPLFILRLPPVRRWWKRNRGRPSVYLAGLLLLTLFAYGAAHLVGEEINKGVQAFTLHPKDD